MSSGLAMTFHLLLERLSPGAPLPRVPEPQLIMDDDAQNEAFEQVGREDGLLAFVHLYQALQIAPLLRHGDRVLDLGCGPANQLVQVARLNPRAHFTGLDAAAGMLAQARETVRRGGVTNIEPVHGDMTTLSGFDDGSFDAVMSTLSLHHLPDEAALVRTMQAARRVLKPDGAIYLIDFGRLKRAATQRFLAEDRRDLQPDAFTRDYLNSQRAAFSVGELSRAAQAFGDRLSKYETALAPFMVVFRTSARRALDEGGRHLAQSLYDGMNATQQSDFQRYARWFRMGGLGLPFTPA
ncbi:MAG: class I SAM-dependent methyltransferase [Betaproteobacteria bacterium]|nr:class I SAM-dependent methyltransferase [Betaproteobacteria bacterium]